jgi:hypothetical protein
MGRLLPTAPHTGEERIEITPGFPRPRTITHQKEQKGKINAKKDTLSIAVASWASRGRAAATWAARRSVGRCGYVRLSRQG